jgi:alkylation response protein AidB-like acyl-CoA dehydrogenase
MAELLIQLRMQFSLTKDQRRLRDNVRAFGREEIAPVALEYERKAEFPAEVFQAAADQGFVGSMIPSEYGGPGRDMVESAIVTEQLWRADTGVGWAIGLSGFDGNVYMLENFGDEWMKEEFFPQLAAGDLIDGIAVTEPEAGSNVANIQTTAERDGDEWVINGKKKFIGNGAIADYLLTIVKTDPGAGHKGISLFYVPTDTDGLEAESIEHTFGGRAANVALVDFENVRVPASNLIGEENKGFYHFMESLEYGRVSVAARAVGSAQAALDAAVEYAENRVQFDQPIAEHQAIRHKIAEMTTNIEAARVMLYRAAELVAMADDRASHYANMAKLFASEIAVEVTDEAIQIHGGNGYLGEHDVERYYRDARGTKIYEGTSEIQKNIIAKEVLGQ